MSNLVRSDLNRIISFEETVNNLAPALAQSKYSVWIYFKAGDLEIDTRKKEDNFFMSCNNRKNGSGQANSFSVCLAYVPKIDTVDINYIDKKICGTDNSLLGNKTLSSTDEQGAALRDVILQYGYNELNVFSPRYVGKLLDYGVEIQNGMLMYTLTGYSGVVQKIEDKHSFDQIGYVTGEGDQLESHDTERPTNAVKKAFEKYLPDDYTIEIDASASNKDKPVVIGAMNDATIFQYADSVLSLAQDENASEDLDINQKSIYYYTVSDVEGQKKVTIKRSDPTDLSSAKANVVFDWMGGFGNNTNIYTGNMVINFTTQFKGVIALAAMSNKQRSENNEDEYSYSIDSYGNTVSAKTFIGDAYSGDYLKSDASVFMSQWSKATNYAYKATLTTIGLPCDIPIGEYIRVRPLIYGREHYTSGVYMIVGTEDTVDTSGFTTTLNLIRVGNNN